MKNSIYISEDDEEIQVIGQVSAQDNILFKEEALNDYNVPENIKTRKIEEEIEEKKSSPISKDSTAFEEKKRKIEESIIKYCLKYFVDANILDISFNISTENYVISRRIYIPDYIDLNLFIQVIKEIFEWEGKPWQFKVKNFKLTSSPEMNEVLYETENTQKIYKIHDVKLNKLLFNKDEKFTFIYDRLSEVWNVNCKVEYIHSVKDLIARKYNNEKDRNSAFKKIKSLFRPILIKGQGIYPPDELGGQKALKAFLKHRNDITHQAVIQYISYYRSLLCEQENEENQDSGDEYEFNNKDFIEEFLNTDFDFIELQNSLGTIEFVKYYEKEANPMLKKKEKTSIMSEIPNVNEDEPEEEEEIEEEDEEPLEVRRKCRIDNDRDVKSIRERETEREERESKYENYINIQKEVSDLKSEKIQRMNNKAIRIDTSASKKTEKLKTEEKKEVLYTNEPKKNPASNSVIVVETKNSKPKDALSVKENISIKNQEKSYIVAETSSSKKIVKKD